MRSIRCALLTAFLLAASFCHSQFGVFGSSLRWSVIASGTSSTITQQGYRDALDKTTLTNYWTQILQQGGVPPMVDFFRDRVLIIFLGQRNTGGYSAQIGEIRHDGVGQATIAVRELTPAQGAITGQALSQPWVMITIDRSYSVFRLTFEKVQSPSNPGIQIGPLTTLYPAPFQPCFGGWGGPWETPRCALFSNWNDFSNWGNRNQLSWNGGIPNLNWGNEQLLFVTPGNFGLGFNTSILGMQVRGNVGILQIERTSRVTQLGRDGVPWNTVSINSSIRQVQVELIDRGSNAMLAFGSYQARTAVSNSILRSTNDLKSQFGTQFNELSESVRNFDFSKSNLYLIANPSLNGVSLSRVVYRGSRAELQYRRNRATNTFDPLPYQLVKLDKTALTVSVSTDQ